MAQNEKKALRRQILRERRAVTPEKRMCRDAAILRHLLQWVESVPREKPIFCYVGTDFEITTHTFIAACLHAGREVCVPLCRDFGIMEARRITSLSDLHTGAFGLLEPKEACPAVSPETLGAVVAPGLAFDAAGYRLGRGGGFYDRYLAMLPEQTVTCGLCYREFICDVPRDSHDRPVESIITEEGVIPCS